MSSLVITDSHIRLPNRGRYWGYSLLPSGSPSFLAPSSTPGYPGCSRSRRFHTALPGFPHMLSGSSLTHLILSRERKHNLCRATSLVPLVFYGKSLPQLREEFLACIITPRRSDVIHVNSHHQGHLIVNHQPRNTTLPCTVRDQSPLPASLPATCATLYRPAGVRTDTLKAA